MRLSVRYFADATIIGVSGALVVQVEQAPWIFFLVQGNSFAGVLFLHNSRHCLPSRLVSVGLNHSAIISFIFFSRYFVL